MFRELCLQNGFLNGRNISHVLMDGGVLSVPFDRLNLFYEICVQCIKSNEHIFVVEQKTEIYNFFLDIDFNDDDALDLGDILRFSKIIFSVIRQFSSEEQLAIVSTSNPKKKGTKIKTGIHINFPGLIIDKTNAIQLMYHIINSLKEEAPEYDWFRFIDPSVYGTLGNNSKGSGFRMPWSHKKSKHDDCKGSGCEVCFNTGKVTEGVYLPVYVLTSQKEKILKKDNYKNTLWLKTIRTENKLADVLQIPEVVNFEKITQTKKKEGEFTKNQTKNEIFNSDLKVFLETFIRKNLEGQKDARVSKIFKNKTSYLIQTNSKYCENLKRSHSSNHIWFYIDLKDKTICQKCFCRCETTEGRRHGLCKNFSGRKSFLNSKINEIIIDNKKKTCGGFLFQ